MKSIVDIICECNSDLNKCNAVGGELETDNLPTLEHYGGDIELLADRLIRDILSGFTVEIVYDSLIDLIFDECKDINIFIHNGTIFINKKIV